LGITNLEFQNICLLSKWLFKLLNDEGMWQNMLKRKYIDNKVLSQVVKKPGDSQLWKGLLTLKISSYHVGDLLYGMEAVTGFGKTFGLGNEPLMLQYPSLYNIARKKNKTVANVLNTRPLNISFRRAQVGDKLRMWLELVAKIMNA